MKTLAGKPWRVQVAARGLWLPGAQETWWGQVAGDVQSPALAPHCGKMSWNAWILLYSTEGNKTTLTLVRLLTASAGLDGLWSALTRISLFFPKDVGLFHVPVKAIAQSDT